MKIIDHLSIEQLWDLNQSDRNAVLEHLNRMTTENGWHPEQKKSAQIASQAIEEFAKGNIKK
jgi:hypothetical protein